MVTAVSLGRRAPGVGVPALEIGVTYDLREVYLARGLSAEDTAEFDHPATIDALAGAIGRLGHRVVRIGHLEPLIDRLRAGERWDLVWNISEGWGGLGRESLVPALLDHHGIPYTFSDPAVLGLCLHKAHAKRVVRDAGIPTPDFRLYETDRDLRCDLPLPLFVKPLAEGTSKGVSESSIVRSKRVLAERCRELLRRYRQPVLVETFLPGREFTVGLLGTGEEARVIGSLEVRLLPGAERDVYSYRNKEHCEQLVSYQRARPEDDPVVAHAEALALRAWRVLGCRDAGRIDVRCDEAGRPSFIEANPLAGLHPSHSDLPILCTRVGITYDELIAAILRSAWSRAAAERGAGQTVHADRDPL